MTVHFDPKTMRSDRPNVSRGHHRIPRWVLPTILIVIAAAVLVGFAALIIVNTTDQGTAVTPTAYDSTAAELVQESIDAALAEQAAVAVSPSAAELVQESIDAALAEQAAAGMSSYELVQQSIEQALAELQAD